MSEKSSQILTCFRASWSPVIGDPSVMGWVTVASYAVAAMLTARLAFGEHGRPERTFWVVLAVLLACLTVNKQLDLQSAMTAFARCQSKAQGWYQNRRVVQTAFISAILALAVVSLFGLIIVMRRNLRRTWVAILGTVFLSAFIVIRAAGFRHFDNLIGSDLAGIRVNWLLELTGIGLITANAIVLLRRAPPSRKLD